jgi:hypothetical protein
MEILRAETNEFPHLKVNILNFDFFFFINQLNILIEYRWSNK